ncbi:MAG: cache domain-containing protein, partial [Rhodospirillales bacterium]|nr:cache domain-containing protein [Rhodospirillales bacterium]
MDRMTGKKRLIAILVVLLVAGFLAVSLSVYRVARDTVLESISAHQLPLTGDNIYSEIQKDLLRPIFISSMMAQDTFLRDWALAGEGDEGAVTRYLKEIKDRYQTVTSFFVSERSRTYYHHSGRFKTVAEADERDSWYFRVRALTEPYEINVDPDWTNRETLTIFINYRVFDYQGRFLGATGVGLTVDTVRHLLESYQARFKRRITFVDRQGRVVMRGSVAHIGADNLAEAPGIGPLAPVILATGPAGALFEYQYEGAQWLVNTRFIPELNWHLMVEQSVDESLKPAQAALVRSLAISALVTVIVTLLAAVVLTYFQRRLETMATTDLLTGLLN